MKTFHSGLRPRLFIRRPSGSLLACAFFLHSAADHKAWAQSPPTDQTQLPAVTVTATRTPARVDEAVAEVSVITRDDIEQASGLTLTELLARQPGIQFTSNGGWGKNSSISLRGLETRHTLVLVDGVRFGSATAGVPLLDNIPIDEIERIEIVRGPMSSLYGSDAVGGVIQVFTRKLEGGMHANGAGTLGSKRFAKATGGFAIGDGNWSGAMQLSHMENRGFSSANAHVPFDNFNPDDDRFRQNAGSARLNVKLGGDWQASGTFMEANAMNAYDDGPDADTRGTTHSRVASVQLSGSQLPGWSSVTRVGRSSDESVTVVSASPFTDLGAFSTVQQQISREDSIETRIGTVLLLAEHLKQKVNKPAASYTVTTRSILGFAAGLNGRQGAHTWQASVRQDSNSQFGDEATGALAYGYEIAKAWRVAASAGTSFVSPSFNQLYYPGFGNPNLLPEQGTSAELSLRYSGASQQLRAALFRNRIRGYITSGPSPSNLPKTQIDGITFSHEARVAGWELESSLDYVNPRNKTENTANYDKLLPRRAKTAFKTSLDGDVGPVRLGASLTAFGERYDNPGNTIRLPGYATMDLRTEWRFMPDWTLGASLNNIANKQYETAYGYNQPGRELYVTLRFSQR